MHLSLVLNLLEDLRSSIAELEVEVGDSIQYCTADVHKIEVHGINRERVEKLDRFEVPVLEACSASIHKMIRTNVPFIVTGDGAFSRVVEAWTTSTAGGGGGSTSPSSTINLPHLVHTFGSWEVPVKKNLESADELDADGRAVEPECLIMTMKEWVEEVSDDDGILRWFTENLIFVHTYPSPPLVARSCVFRPRTI